MAALIKLLMIAVVVVGALYLLRGRRSDRGSADSQASRDARPADAAAMVACAHCGVHLPSDDAVTDREGRRFCSDAHRLAGPR